MSPSGRCPGFVYFDCFLLRGLCTGSSATPASHTFAINAPASAQTVLKLVYVPQVL